MTKSISDEYVYKKEVDWSLFHYGFAIPVEHIPACKSRETLHRCMETHRQWRRLFLPAIWERRW